jgi:hypothetical protein
LNVNPEPEAKRETKLTYCNDENTNKLKRKGQYQEFKQRPPTTKIFILKQSHKNKIFFLQLFSETGRQTSIKSKPTYKDAC